MRVAHISWYVGLGISRVVVTGRGAGAPSLTKISVARTEMYSMCGMIVAPSTYCSVVLADTASTLVVVMIVFCATYPAGRNSPG